MRHGTNDLSDQKDSKAAYMDKAKQAMELASLVLGTGAEDAEVEKFAYDLMKLCGSTLAATLTKVRRGKQCRKK